MTTLYRPVLIESAEQAEALPVGTIARHDDHMPVEKWEAVYGETHWGDAEDGLTDVDMIGWTALVPIEAEEEVAPAPFSHRTRYVTPWEDA